MSENNTNPNKNWLTEEEAIALASGVSVEKAAAMLEGAGDRKKERDAVAATFREELQHAGEPGVKVMSADREFRYCLELQRERIANRGLQLTEEMIPGAYFRKA